MSLLTQQVYQELLKHFPGSRIEIQDDSHRHEGHAGHSGGGHLAVWMVSERFQGLSLIQRHRLIYQALGDWIPGRIHALSLRLLTPAECSESCHK
ncbi:MAG: BolA family protein [Thermostichales cyanobacterium BF4_bins_65]